MFLERRAATTRALRLLARPDRTAQLVTAARHLICIRAIHAYESRPVVLVARLLRAVVLRISLLVHVDGAVLLAQRRARHAVVALDERLAVVPSVAVGCHIAQLLLLGLEFGLGVGG